MRQPAWLRCGKSGMVRVRQIPSYIICGYIRCGILIPWGWGWLHRSWSFAIPKLRLRLPPGIEPCGKPAGRC